MKQLKHHLLCYCLILTILSLKAQEPGNNNHQQNEKGTRIFFDNFSKDTVGKSPSNWESNVYGEVVTLKNYPGKWLKMHAGGTYLIQFNQTMPTAFSVEFDFIYQALGTDYNVTEIAIFEKKQGDTYDDFFPGNKGIKIFLENFIVSYLCYNQQKADDKKAMEHRTNIIRTNKKVKVLIEVNNQQIKLYVNQQKFLEATICLGNMQFNAMRFHLWGSQAEPLISDFSIISH